MSIPEDVFYKTVKIIWDKPYTPPDCIFVSPLFVERWKKAEKWHKKMYGRRDRRRKHKRHVK